ncbi:MAG: hypothetical protein IJA50_03040 [Firmicutes bacterium]|nr:hypothetical protein [Bacillota bacterium]MBR2620179.1 hypothetical protein [Bacillota bacterium]MBR6799213.1 hypothetical protein [Bacillota bacterium]
MDYKKQIIDKVESFYLDVVEEFKEAEMQIIKDSKFKMIFKKKNYDGNIEHLKKCKKMALNIDVDDIEIPADDRMARQVVKAFEKCLVHFNNLCDTHTRLQMGLKGKAENKEQLKFSDYKELFQKVQTARNSLNSALHEMDLVYTDYAYDEDEDTSIKYVE